jgi:hypothetical protein
LVAVLVGLVAVVPAGAGQVLVPVLEEAIEFFERSVVVFAVNASAGSS